MKVVGIVVSVIAVVVVALIVVVALFIGGMQLFDAYGYAGLFVAGLVILLLKDFKLPPSKAA